VPEHIFPEGFKLITKGSDLNLIIQKSSLLDKKYMCAQAAADFEMNLLKA
jgi:hypothetical protein